MKVVQTDHIAIAVKDRAQASENFCDRLGGVEILRAVSESIGYSVTYFDWGGTVFTMLSPDREDNFVTKDIARRGEGLHHMGIEVENLEAAEKQLVAKGGVVHHYEKMDGIRKGFVIAPKGNNGILLQVLEYEPQYKGMTAADRYRLLSKTGKLGM